MFSQSALRLSVRENGQHVTSMWFNPTPSQVRIITSHDTISLLDVTLRQSTVLFPVVRHQDGSLVEEANPAKPGEPLSMWAVGLFYDKFFGLVKTGEPSLAGVTATDLGIRFDFGFSLPPKRPEFASGEPTPTDGLLWAGLVPGQVGVSQINFRVPGVIPPGTPACGGRLGGNLTVSIGYQYIWWRQGQDTNYDGASICVEVPKPVTAAPR
jgi:hypothetical protein